MLCEFQNNFIILLVLECESSNENFEKTYIGYFKPMDLVRYYNCTRNITVNSDDSSKVNCTTEEIHQLYENITKRFGDDKWCTDAIGLNVTVKFIDFVDFFNFNEILIFE